jgi:epoxyqueuosine reductase
MSQARVEDILNSTLSTANFSHFGWTELKSPLSMDIYRTWIAEQKHGEMTYLQTHLSTKENPHVLLDKARSAIVVAQSYLPHPKPQTPFPGTKIARYASGEDYHHWFKEKLQSVCAELEKLYPGEEFLPFTDSAPILERDLAFQAGLGFFGKNTCLIHPKKGSFFLIGEIITSLSYEGAAPSTLANMCGTCTRCMDQCPTGAITAPQSVDARRCISYLTIESRKIPQLELRSSMGDWLFGCDICQSVCPWNQKAFKNELTKDLEAATSRETTLSDLRFLLTASGKQIEKKVLGTPLKRAGPFGLRRNALVVSANIYASELTAEIAAWKTDPRLGELAEWALQKIENRI